VLEGHVRRDVLDQQLHARGIPAPRNLRASRRAASSVAAAAAGR
jgi:hypothetical protein